MKNAVKMTAFKVMENHRDPFGPKKIFRDDFIYKNSRKNNDYMTTFRFILYKYFHF